MKKNYRLIGTLTMAALLAGNLSGCGSARNYQTETAAEYPVQDNGYYSTATLESYGDYAEVCEEPMMAAPSSPASSLFDSLGSSKAAETEDCYVYGDALMYSGVKLKQAFGGTGYNDEVRFYQDFGSRMYFMEEE